MWRSRMGIGKALYLATRYMGFSDTIVVMFCAHVHPLLEQRTDDT